MKDVIKYAGKVHLVFEPLKGVKALEQLWDLAAVPINAPEMSAVKENPL